MLLHGPQSPEPKAWRRNPEVVSMSPSFTVSPRAPSSSGKVGSLSKLLPLAHLPLYKQADRQIHIYTHRHTPPLPLTSPDS